MFDEKKKRIRKKQITVEQKPTSLQAKSKINKYVKKVNYCT